jgi:hypothetical protein
MGRFPGEKSCLTLVWAVLDLLITHQTNGIHFNQIDRQRLKRMRYQGTKQTSPEEVTAAQTDHHREPEPRRIYSGKETPPPDVPDCWVSSFPVVWCRTCETLASRKGAVCRATAQRWFV